MYLHKKNWVDETVVDEIGLDETALDEPGVDETGINRTFLAGSQRHDVSLLDQW